MKNDAEKATDKAPEKAAETPVQVWFLVSRNGAVIGECHHAADKRMKLPKPQAEEAQAQGLGSIDGVA